LKLTNKTFMIFAFKTLSNPVAQIQHFCGITNLTDFKYLLFLIHNVEAFRSDVRYLKREMLCLACLFYVQ